MKKTLYLVLINLSLIIVLWVSLNWKNLRVFPQIISSFYAKEFCSCYYVQKRDENFCHNFSRQYVPISGFENDTNQKKVTVTGLMVTNSASFVNEKFGCILEPKDFLKSE